MFVFEGLSIEEARRFADSWLPAWTGNEPERLLEFYADDAFYSDPAIPQGIRGRGNLQAYFKKLLERNPEWVWEQIEAVPMEGGFVNKWRARIPAGSESLTLEGVCLVWLRGNRISRNEVYFDRTSLMEALKKEKHLSGA